MAESVEAALARIDQTLKGVKDELIAKLDGHRELLSAEISHAASEAAQNLRLAEQRVTALEDDVKDIKGGMSVLETHLENRVAPLETFQNRTKGALAVLTFLGFTGLAGLIIDIIKIVTH